MKTKYITLGLVTGMLLGFQPFTVHAAEVMPVDGPVNVSGHTHTEDIHKHGNKEYVAAPGHDAQESVVEVMEIKEVTPEVKSTVKNLIERTMDGKKGYAEASENASSPWLKARFMSKSYQRAEFAEELRAELAKAGTSVKEDGSLEAAVHRAWIDVKAFVTGKDDIALLKAVHTGESEALQTYEEALKHPLPKSIRRTVAGQANEIRDSIVWVNQRIRSLEQEKKK